MSPGTTRAGLFGREERRTLRRAAVAALGCVAIVAGGILLFEYVLFPQRPELDDPDRIVASWDYLGEVVATGRLPDSGRPVVDVDGERSVAITWLGGACGDDKRFHVTSREGGAFVRIDHNAQGGCDDVALSFGLRLRFSEPLAGPVVVGVVD